MDVIVSAASAVATSVNAFLTGTAVMVAFLGFIFWLFGFIDIRITRSEPGRPQVLDAAWALHMAIERAKARKAGRA